MGRYQKPVDRPGSIAQRRMERRQHHKRAAILIKLPDGKAEAAFGAINPEHLPALPDEDREGPARMENRRSRR
jgi:hypothetical protein